MIYLFLGTDNREKDSRIKELLSSLLPAGTENFNCDTFWGNELRLHTVQERLKSLPVNSPVRVVIIRSAQKLSEQVKSYLLEYAAGPYKSSVLIVEAEPKHNRDAFLAGLESRAKVYRSKKIQKEDTFLLCRYIDYRRPADALKLLGHLLAGGEPPERIIGGMRYIWQKTRSVPAAQAADRMSRLLECDRQIKTGRLKPHRALEKLVIELTAF